MITLQPGYVQLIRHINASVELLLFCKEGDRHTVLVNFVDATQLETYVEAWSISVMENDTPESILDKALKEAKRRLFENAIWMKGVLKEAGIHVDH